MDLFQIERITSNHIAWKSGQKEKIVELYKEGYSINQIRKLFNGLHYNTIKKILVENNVTLRTRAQSHYKDNRVEDVFEKIDTEEKAYWLGFLAADGCISGNYIIIALQGTDIEHLKKFQTFVKADSIKITEYQRNGKNYCRFSFACKKIAEDLKKHGITERKTLTLKPPVDFLEEKFYFDWIRGYFDGDGGLSYSATSNRWQSYVNSTREVLQWIVDVLELNTKPFQQKHWGKFDNVWRIHFNGRINVYTAWNKMFHDDNATIYLERKYKKYKQLRSSF